MVTSVVAWALALGPVALAGAAVCRVLDAAMGLWEHVSVARTLHAAANTAIAKQRLEATIYREIERHLKP